MIERPRALVFVHGVGMWPELFNPIQRSLRGERYLWTRPGYDDCPAVSSFEEQVDALEIVIAKLYPAVLVGVSGGATLALACAIRNAPGLRAVITHEPLVGALQPDLDERVRKAGKTILASQDLDEARRFLQRLYGPDSWNTMPYQARDWVETVLPVVANEIAQFSSFQPSLEELGSIEIPHLTTVGSRSGAERHAVAELLSSVGARKAVIDRSGHLVQVDNPEAFVGRIESFTERFAVV